MHLFSSIVSPVAIQAAPWLQAGGGDFTFLSILSTLVYGLIGILLYIISYYLFDKVLHLDMRRELLTDQNQALGIMMAGIFIGIAIIIAAAII